MTILATTIEQQLEILAERNILLTKDSDTILLQYSYYNLINGYKDAFIGKSISRTRGTDFYFSGTSLSDIVNLYLFDANLRRSLLNCITIVETQMKSIISLYFSLRYGTNHWDYLRPDSFTRSPHQTKRVNNLLYHINKSI